MKIHADCIIGATAHSFQSISTSRSQERKSVTHVSASARAKSAHGPEPSRGLVVENEALVALQLQNGLEHYGCHVIGPARSLKHGQLLAARERLDAA